MKFRYKILFILVFLAVLGFIFLLPHGGYRRQVEAYKRQLIAKGEKLTIAELAPPPLPAEVSNGATAFLQLMEDCKVPTNLPTPMRIIVPGLANIAYTNLNSAAMLDYEENLSNVAKLRKILNAPILDLDPNFWHGAGIDLSHPEKIKKATLLLTDTAAQAVYANNSLEAQSDLLAAINLVRISTNEPEVLMSLFRVSLARIAFSATWEALQCAGRTDQQLMQLQEQCQNMDLFQNSDVSVALERDWMIAEIEKTRRTNYDGSQFVFNDFTPGASGSSGTGGVPGSLREKINDLYDRYPRFWKWKTSWSYDEELCYLQTVENALAACGQVKTTSAFVPALVKLRADDANVPQAHPESTNHFLFLFDVSGEFGIYLRKFAEVEAARRLVVTAIALKRYHLQHGAYPAGLNELVPVFLSTVPADFMDGKPLRYKLRPDGDFLLYSVGEDGVDDGGDATPATATSGSINWLNGRDIVWPRVATPAALEEYHRQSQSATKASGK